MLYIVYADLEYWVKKIGRCANDPEKSSTTKIGEHIPCGYSMSTIQGFDHIKNKHTLDHGKDCLKRFCESLKEHGNRIIHFEKKKMLPLTNKELKSHKDEKVCYICGKFFIKKIFRDINYWQVRDHCHCRGKYRGLTHSICDLKFKVSNEIPVVFYNGSKSDYHLIIKELAHDFEGPFECIGENWNIWKFFCSNKKGGYKNR